MIFGGAVKHEVNYKTPGKKNEKPTAALTWMLGSASVRQLDKIPLPQHGWRNNYLGEQYYKFKQIPAHHFRGVCAVHAKAQDTTKVAEQARSSGAQRRRIDTGKGPGKGKGKRSGKRSRKCSDKSPGKGSGNAAEPPEPAASKTTKMVPGPR